MRRSFCKIRSVILLMRIKRQAGRLDLSSFGSLTGWLVGLLILSVIIVALYLVLIAQHVRAAPLSLPALARSFVRTLGRLLIFTLLIGLLLALASIPLALFAGVLTLVGGAAGSRLSSW